VKTVDEAGQRNCWKRKLYRSRRFLCDNGHAPGTEWSEV